jgi:sensor histidine kinase YesM
MNHHSSAANDMLARERLNFVDEPPVWGGDMDLLDRNSPRSTVLLRRAALPLILLFFATQFSTMTFSRYIRAPDEGWEVIAPRLIVAACGILFSLLNLAVQQKVSRGSLKKRVLIAAILTIASCYVHAAVNLAVFGLFIGFGTSPLLEYLLAYHLSAQDWLWFYSAISVMILALTYAADLAESDGRISSLQRQAHAAQLKALRYQLNPHFLFNTLNSIAALIGQGRSADAEMMVESLSDFLRSTLTMDTGKEIPLGAEIQLQALYLDIEKIRFPARLHVTIDVPSKLRDVLVPNLITQPLVENSIKYGVAQSSERVNVAIIAREADGLLSLQIKDDGGNAASTTQQAGTRTGLRNVSERLRLHFGEAAWLKAGPRPGGGFSTEILMPLKRA